MSEIVVKTAAEQIAEIEARREKRKQAFEDARVAQLAIDLEALDKAEEEYGFDHVGRLNLATYTPGLPTMVIVRSADRHENKRYQDMCTKTAKGGHVDTATALKAAELTADACVIYPDRETYKRLREVCEVHARAGSVAIELFGAERAAEGKG